MSAERVRAEIAGSGQEMIRALTGEDGPPVTASIGIALLEEGVRRGALKPI